MSAFSNLINDIKESMRGEPHTLEEIRSELQNTRTDDVDIYDLISDHHDYLKESIVVLMDVDADPTKKRMHLSRFLTLLDMHARAEEETLYQELKANSDKMARIEALGAQREHDVAKELASELRGLQFEQSWSEEIDAKAKVIASLVTHHMDEEESEIFSVARAGISDEVAETIGMKYLERCKMLLSGSTSGTVDMPVDTSIAGPIDSSMNRDNVLDEASVDDMEPFRRQA